MRIVRSVILSSSVRLAVFTVLALSASAPGTEAMCVDVSMRFRGGSPAPRLVESMKEEASWIWASYGVRIGWPTADGTRGCAQPLVSVDLLVDRRRSRMPKMVLGSTRLAPSPIRHAPIHVDYGATEQLLESLTVGELYRLLGRPIATSVDLGRALGRVLAHEIGHVILATASHQEQGLMRPQFLAIDLVRPERRAYLLSLTEVDRLRQRELALNTQ